ncbi:hypothetical protein [Actinoplanes lobatus]|uniref:Uncharacterized protein n=1 Tax=Actinoplanes lobatus TaxID=113568 RepID=A0A7W7HEG2_9ACTN|nr:hypothetical protein [Actinoplanes lobatus]MBB4748985.1 hypothetical protein [Actinoplanes lobatus]
MDEAISALRCLPQENAFDAKGRNDDGPGPLTWAVVTRADDENQTRVISSEDRFRLS